MPKTMIALASETNMLIKLFDAVMDTHGAQLTIWESEQPACVDVLHAWAYDRGYEVKTRHTNRETLGSGVVVPAHDVFVVELDGHREIAAYR